jgi:putative hydrolase of the HAD superfamily
LEEYTLIRNIVFDIGRVLLEFNPIAYLDEKYNNPFLSRELHKAIFGSNEWLELDRGTVTDEDAIEILSERHDAFKEHIPEIIGQWNEILIPIEGTVEILRELKSKGYNIYLLSNFHKSAFEKVYHRYPFLSLADGKIVSYKINMIKPDDEIYEYLLNTFSLKPEECLFIDDTAANTEAAHKLGFNTIQFQNPIQLKNDLINLNILEN